MTWPDFRRWCVFSMLAAIWMVTGCAAGQREEASGSERPQNSTPAPGDQDPTWRWSDARVEEFWRRVSRGRSLKPRRWPGGARVAVALSFDYQMGTIYDPNPAASSNTNSEYDGMVGLRRLLKLLDKHQVPASFFVTGITAQLYPDTVEEIVASGRHEVAVHGWIHERATDLAPADERRLLHKAIESLQAVTGERPVGYRSPSWQFSDATLSLLREAGFLYDSGMMADDDPYEIVANGQPTGLIEVPVEWLRDDAMYFPRSGPSNPMDVFEVWRLEFDMAYAEGGLFQITMHPRITGHRSRTMMLDKLISYMKDRPDVWFGTHEDVARHVAPMLSSAGVGNTN